MFEKIISVYIYLFGRTRFLKFNKLLYRMSLGGLGILNYKTSKASGEKSFLLKYLKKINISSKAYRLSVYQLPHQYIFALFLLHHFRAWPFVQPAERDAHSVYYKYGTY